MVWAYGTIAGLFALAAGVYLVRYARWRDSGQLLIGGCLLLAGGIFGGVALVTGNQASAPPTTSPKKPLDIAANGPWKTAAPPGQQPKLRATFEGHSQGGIRVAFSRDGKMLASGSRDSTLRLWDVITGKPTSRNSTNQDDPLEQAHDQPIECLVFSSDDKTLATASWDKTVMLWDLTTVTAKVTKKLTDRARSIRPVAISGDLKLLASASADGSVTLWDIATGETILNLGQLAQPSDQHRGQACLAFSGDGMLMALGSSDGNVRLWDLANRTEKAPFQGHTAGVPFVGFSGDGKLLASASDDATIKIWHVATGAVLRTLKGHTNEEWSVAFSSDGKKLAAASSATLEGNGVVRLLDAATGEEKATLTGHMVRSISCVAFSSNGELLAVAARQDDQQSPSSGRYVIYLFEIPSNAEAGN